MYPAVWRPPPPRLICYYCGIRGYVARVCRRHQRGERDQYGHFRKEEAYSSYGYRPTFVANAPHHDDTNSSYPYRPMFLPNDSPRFSSPSPSPDRSSNVRSSRRCSPSPFRCYSSPLRPTSQTPGRHITVPLLLVASTSNLSEAWSP
ncbi:hypothetical protein V5799_024876 [Amblyomma americanum]|uniref:Uncharacterized protein n=1 Tax=Amblyomma americanum TaxID=6943 RepID=A0AAQ4EB63_AMBAM